jgi:hypothetical protein
MLLMSLVSLELLLVILLLLFYLFAGWRPCCCCYKTFLYPVSKPIQELHMCKKFNRGGNMLEQAATCSNRRQHVLLQHAQQAATCPAATCSNRGQHVPCNMLEQRAECLAATCSTGDNLSSCNMFETGGNMSGCNMLICSNRLQLHTVFCYILLYFYGLLEVVLVALSLKIKIF